MGLELAESTYPAKIGGNAAGMVLGMRTPHLLPKEQFTLPSGLLVSRTEIMDVYGSRLVFGGTIAQITQANEIAGIHCTSLEGQKFYHTEYLVFRDSINGNRNLTQNWNEGTQNRTTLIRDEDENKSCGSMDCYNRKKKQNSTNAIDVSLCVPGELRSKSKKEWEFQEFHTQNEDITTHLDISTEVCEQEEAISNFNKTFNWSKSSKRDIKSNTIAGPVLHCQQTKFSTPKDVENHNLGSSKEELEYDLTSSSVESEVELDSSKREPEKERRFSEEGIQVKVCGPYNISQQLLRTQRLKTAIIAEDFTKMRLIEIGGGSQYENPIAVYVGFLLQEGTFARSISTDPIYTVLRNNEVGCVPKAKCVYILGHTFKNRIGDNIKVKDSRDNTCWEMNDNLRLKVFSRDHLIKRLDKNNPRYWTKGTNDPSSFASKMGYTLKLLVEGSEWISGFLWMNMDVREMIASETIIHLTKVHSSLSPENWELVGAELLTLGDLFPLVQRNLGQKKVRFKVTTEIITNPNRYEILDTCEEDNISLNRLSYNIITISDSEDFTWGELNAESGEDLSGPARGIPTRVDSTAPRHITERSKSEQAILRKLINDHSVAKEKARYCNSKSVFTPDIKDDNDLVYALEECPKGNFSYSTTELITSFDIQEALRQAKTDSKISEFKSEFIHYKCHDESVHPTSRGERSRGNPTSAGGSKMQTCLVATRADQNVREEVLKLPRAPARKKGRCKSCDQVSIIDTVFYGLRKALLYTSIFASCHHKTNMGLKARGENPVVQANLEAKCQVCQFHCKLCEFAIGKCDICLQGNLETQRSPVGEFKTAHGRTLDKIFGLDNMEMDFFEEAGYRSEICLVNCSIRKVEVSSSKVRKSTEAASVDGDPSEGLSSKGDDPVNVPETSSSTESNNVNTNMFPEGCQNQQMRFLTDKIPEHLQVRISHYHQRKTWRHLMPFPFYRNHLLKKRALVKVASLKGE